MFFALDSKNGKTKWSYNGGHQIESAPILDANGVIYMVTGNGVLRALDQKGNRIWEYNMKDNTVSAPAIGADGTIYLVSQNGRVTAVGK